MKKKSKITKRKVSKVSKTKVKRKLKKKVSKRKNPILISGDETSITFEELISHLPEQKRSLLIDLMFDYADIFDKLNYTSISPKQLSKIIDKSLEFDDYSDIEFSALRGFQYQVDKLPQHLEIELPTDSGGNGEYHLSHKDSIMKKLKTRHRQLY